jgi:cell division protein FtsN
MKTVNLSTETDDKESPSESNGRQKRLLIILLVVLLIGAAAIAAQQFLLKEKKPAVTPMRGPVATVPPVPPPVPLSPTPSVKPSEPVQPAPAGSLSAPSFPPPAATPKTEEAKELPKASRPARHVASAGSKAQPLKGYALQVVACADETTALEHTKKLKAEGVSSKISKSRAMLTKHSVYLGDFSGPEEAAALGLRLKEGGIGVTLHMTEGGRYSFLVSSYFTLNEAVDAAHDLEKKGYAARIRETTAQAPVYRVRIEHLANRGQAAALIGRLRGLGYSPVVVRE